MWQESPLAFFRLFEGEMSRLHVVLEQERQQADVNSQSEGVGNADPEISVEVKQTHAETSSTATEPPIGLVQVLQEEVGEEGGSYEEESVH